MKEAVIELDGLCFSSNRAYGGEGEIKILAEDIRLNGLINPITVMPFEGGGDVFEVVAGRRRVLAVTKLGWKAIPCRVLEGDEIERAGEISGAENINRLSMHPLDEAAVFRKLLENGEAAGELAKRFDRTVSAIWQRVQLLGLSDGVKELFMDGKITLHAAAMLKSLDREQQSAFYDKFKEGVGVSTWDVKCFISKSLRDKLHTCITGKDCAGCDKRTFYNDKALFPELDGEDDLCLDHECYMGKWRKLLSGKIKKIKADTASHAEADIIVCGNDELAKMLGKKLTLGGTEFTVEKTAWDNRPNDKPGKTSKPCFLINNAENFTCVPLYWKEKAKKEKEKEENPFMPMAKLLDLPKDEAKQTADALLAKYKTKHTWEINQKARDIGMKVRKNVLDRLIDIIAANPDNESDTDRFLNFFLDKSNDKDVIKRFAGSENIQDIKKLSVPRMFAALRASTLDEWDLPDVGHIDGTKENEVADWAGVNMSRLKEMYREELRVLMPKPAAKTDAKKPKGDAHE